MIKYKNITKFLQNPLVIIGSVILGLSLGFYDKNIGLLLEPYGNAFMALLEMSLIPIIVCAIVLSISNLFDTRRSNISIPDVISILLLAMVFVAMISTLFTIFANPADDFLNTRSLKVKEISTVSSFVDRQSTEPVIKEELKGFSEFIEDSIPRNIFSAFADSKMLQVIIFSIIFGISVAFMKKSQSTKIRSFFETTLDVFRSIITAITIWLPLGIIALMAGSAGQIGFEMLTQMGGFILKAYSLFLLLFLISTIVISIRSRQSFLSVLRAMKAPILIAFGTRSAILPIPSVLDAFEKKFKFEQTVPKLLVPLGAILGRFGNIAYFAFLSVFIAGVYQTDITISIFLIIALLTILGGLSTAGATGVLTLISLTIVMDPLQLPTGAILPLLIAVDAIIDPMRTLTSVYTNCAAVALVSKRSGTNKTITKKKAVTPPKSPKGV